VRVGRAISRALGRSGYRVALHFHSSEREARALVGELERAGADAFAVRADLRDPGAIPPLVEEVANRFGGLDLLVNSAAVFPRHDPMEVTPGEWARFYAVNARAAFFCAREAARIMGDGGSIVNIADIAAFEAWPSFVPYASTKAALLSMTRGLALAWAPEIRVNAVAPGPVLLPEEVDDTAREAAARRTALGRIGSPDDVAEAVLYLDRAAYVTGEVIRVDGGQHLK
jgi:pteridine reductase